MERRHSTTSDSSTDSRQSLYDGLEGTPGRVAKATSPKVAVNPLQFVKVGPCDLYRSAQEHLKRVEEIKKTKKDQRDDVEDWQSNLDSWKCSRRKRQEHIIERVVEVKKFEIEEQERNRRRSKTFNEMIQERNTRGRLASLPVYHNDEADDLSDLGIGCKSSENHELPALDNNVFLNGDQEEEEEEEEGDTEEEERPVRCSKRPMASSTNEPSAADSEVAANTTTQNEEYTYERAIQSYVNFAETRVKSKSLKEISEMNNDKSIKVSPPPVPAKPTHISLNRADTLGSSLGNIKDHCNDDIKKIIVPKVDVNRRRELFEKIQETEDVNKIQKTSHHEVVPSTRSIKERICSLDRQDSADCLLADIKNNLTISCEKLVKERLQNIQTMSLNKPSVNKKLNEPISSVSLKDRLTNFVKSENNSTKKQPIIEPSVSIKERLNNLQTSINKELHRTVVTSTASNFNEKLATFKENSLKNDSYDGQDRSCNSPSSDVSNNNRRHFRHRSLDSLDVEADNIGNVSFERVQSLEDLDYCRNYPPSTFSGDTDREDSGIHTADVSSSVSQADDYDLHIVNNTLEDIKVTHHNNITNNNNNNQSAILHDKHRLPDCPTWPNRCDDYQKLDNVSCQQWPPSLDTKHHHVVEENTINIVTYNKLLTSNYSDSTITQTPLAAIPECTSETSNTSINVNSLIKSQDNSSLLLKTISSSLDDDNVLDSTSNITLTAIEPLVNKLDEGALNNNKLNIIAIGQRCAEEPRTGVVYFLQCDNITHSSNDFSVVSDLTDTIDMPKKFDENKTLDTVSRVDELNNYNMGDITKEFLSNEILQEELHFDNNVPHDSDNNNKDIVGTDNESNHLLGQLDSGEFMSSGCMSTEDQHVDGVLIDVDNKGSGGATNCVFNLSAAVLEPPKEKPPPPPLEISDDELESKSSKNPSLWRKDSTKRIKKEIRQKRSSFLGIEGSSDDSYLETELELIKPPDMSALLAEERRMEQQLYRQSVCSESDSNQESRDSGVELDHKPQDVWSHSRNDSETYGNQSTTSDEDEIMKKEREIIETLEKEEKIRKQDLGEKLAMRLRELEAEKERLEWEQLNCENSRSQPSQHIYPEDNVQIAKEASIGEDRMRFDTSFHRTVNVAPRDWYDQSSSLQDITQKDTANINGGGIFHDEEYRLECRKSLQDLSRVISAGNHMQKSKQNLYHRRSMPNLQETVARRPPPPPPIIPATAPFTHSGINNVSNHCSQQMTKQTLHALSAAPRSRLISNDTWQVKRKQRPDSYNYQHWLIQEAEHRRITEQQQRQTGTARRPIPSQHAYITPTNKMTNQPSNNQWAKTQAHSTVYNSTWQTSPQQPQRNPPKSKPLPDSIIQTLTQRVQQKMNPDSNNNRRKKEMIIGNDRGSALHVPPVIQNDNTTATKDKMLSVSGKKRCSHCGEELGRGAAMIIESLQLFYHIDCFKCCVCCLQLGDGLMGTDVRVRNNKLHCHNCYSSDDGAKFSCV